MRQEWRVLRFNDVTRQSVARVNIVDDAAVRQNTPGDDTELQQRWWLESPGNHVVAEPNCLAQEYLKSEAAVLAAVLGLHQLMTAPPEGAADASATSTTARNGSADAGNRALRMLCIGLGGGTFPLFLADRFPHMHIDAVEIDPVVVEAATEAMGLPTALPNLRLHTADAVDVVRAKRAEQVAPYDLVCIDAFNGADEVPCELYSPEFVAELAAIMHPVHGTILANFHSTDIRHIATTFKAALLSSDVGGGACFSVATQKQTNVTVVCTRGLQLPEDVAAAKDRLRFAAAYVGDMAGYLFPAGSRACRNYAAL